MKISIFISILLLGAVILIVPCCDQDKRIVKPAPPDPTNQEPVILGMSSDVSSVRSLGITTLYCDAYDPDGDPLTFEWKSAEGGFPSGNRGNEVDWQGPDIEGYYLISVIVSDHQDSDSSAIGIEVR